MLHTDNQLLARWVSLIAELKKTMELSCKANGTTLHYVLASFVLFHSVRPQKRLLILGKAASYVQNASVEAY